MPKNLRNEASVSALVKIATSANRARYGAIWLPRIIATYKLHLLAKPLKPGTPAIENDATRQVNAVTGMYLMRPPIAFRSCVSVALSIEPAFRNKRLLNRPWLSVWKSEPSKAIVASSTARAPFPLEVQSTSAAPSPRRM